MRNWAIFGCFKRVLRVEIAFIGYFPLKKTIRYSRTSDYIAK